MLCIVFLWKIENDDDDEDGSDRIHVVCENPSAYVYNVYIFHYPLAHNNTAQHTIFGPRKSMTF